MVATELRLLNRATPPPFPIEEEPGVDEAVRLRHRIHDLRRPTLPARPRACGTSSTSRRGARSRELGFLEIETPILTKATPEGARDFLVPSRLQPGEFYALPQSPQIMKQLLMIAGFDRYFQIARCFRDEDQRADRQLEFTQIDLEMSFVGVDDVLAVLEEVTVRAWREAIGVELPRPFPRLSYAEAMARYGSDKPDTRVLLELVELTDLFRGTAFRAFGDAVEKGGVVKCLPVHDADALTRGEIDRLEAFVKKELGGARPGLGARRRGRRVAVADREVPVGQRARGHRRSARARGRAPCCSSRPTSSRRRTRSSGACAPTSAASSDASTARAWAPLLVLDFPVFERGRRGRAHLHAHAVRGAGSRRTCRSSRPSPLRVRGTHYDVVMNGLELGSGSLRNHRSDVQRRIFELLGYSKAGDGGALRLPAERARSGRAAARRLRLRARPHGHAARGRGEPARRDRLPEDAAWPGPA